MLKRLLKGGIAAAAMLAVGVMPALAQKTTLTVYTALENDQLGAVQGGDRGRRARRRDRLGARFHGRHHRPLPRREGQPARRHGAGASPPPACCCSRRTACSRPTSPSGVDALKPAFRDPAAPHLDRHGRLPRRDLLQHRRGRQGNGRQRRRRGRICTKPEFKGKLVMPHPASSGTGYLTVAAWLQMMGEAEGLEVHGRAAREHRRLHAFGLARRACRPPRASGSPASRFDMRGASREDQGRADRASSCRRKAPAGTWKRSAIVKGTKNLDARQEDRRLGRDQGRERALFQVLRHRRASRREERAAELSGRRRGSAWSKNDFGWMAENRERILAEWTKRYEMQGRAEVTRVAPTGSRAWRVWRRWLAMRRIR